MHADANWSCVKSQNGNMADEYACLAADAGRDGPAFAREFFGEKRKRVPTLLHAPELVLTGV